MKKFLAVALIPVLAGCLTSKAPPVFCWPLEYRGPVATSPAPKYGVVRSLPVAVRSPYNARAITVLRKDGSVAFDPLNEFAASPAQLARGALSDALAAAGLFKDVVEASSIAAFDVSIEVTVERLALDCRQEDRRTAVAEIVVKLLKGHSILASLRGSGAADAADGNYGEAFSAALSSAFTKALGRLR